MLTDAHMGEGEVKICSNHAHVVYGRSPMYMSPSWCPLHSHKYIFWWSYYHVRQLRLGLSFRNLVKNQERLWYGRDGCAVSFYIQSPSNAYKRFRSIIRKLAVVFLFVKIQNILIRNVWKTQKFAISLSIRTFKILKVTRILG